MQLRSPQFKRPIADGVAGTGQRCVALFAGGKKAELKIPQWCINVVWRS